MARLEGKVETLIAAFTKPGTRAAAAVVFLAAGSLAVAAQERGPDREPQIAAQYREELQPDVMLVDEIGRQRPGNRCGTLPYTGPLDPVAYLPDDRAAPTEVPVWFHVLYHRKKGADVGRVSEAAIEEQMDVLNASLKRHGLTYTLAGITYTNKKFWSRRCSKPGAERQAKQALAVDTARNLNIYTCSLKRFLGYAYYPKGSAGRWWDGVTVHYSTLPGGKIRFYNEGDTIVHEVGHWAGLLHTFAPEPNGCREPGDMVADTPFERRPAYRCEPRDTCRVLPGDDPIHNFMDYGTDSCATEFTRGQRMRMQHQVSTYRPLLSEG